MPTPPTTEYKRVPAIEPGSCKGCAFEHTWGDCRAVAEAPSCTFYSVPADLAHFIFIELKDKVPTIRTERPDSE
jgi:hypothetical protein